MHKRSGKLNATGVAGLWDKNMGYSGINFSNVAGVKLTMYHNHYLL